VTVTYRFGRFELDPGTRQLREEHQPVVLGARAFEVLQFLIEHRDGLVTKAELLDRVWHGLVVEENNLQVHISRLRKVLGPQAIATIPGRGYQFTATLDDIVERAPAGGTRRETPAEPQAPAVLAPPSPIAVPGGERRQLTVLFAELVGAGAQAGGIDPEAAREVLHGYQRVADECVEAYGGHVHQSLGHGVLAGFGYPEAHDNDAERAVLAGLSLVAAIRTLNADRERRGERAIQSRVGVHTGLVVIDARDPDHAKMDLAVGETQDLAARIGAQAAPGSVCITAATRRLLGPQFMVRELHVPSSSAITASAPLFAVESGSDVAPDWEAGRDLTPLVGRAAELEQLLQRWNLARSGRGQAVLVSGEAGIGKSRLLAGLRARIAPEGDAWRAVRCSPFHANNALRPFIDLLDRTIEAGVASNVADRQRALVQMLAAAGVDDDIGQTLICSLLAPGDPDVFGRRPVDLTPLQRRQRTLEALNAWLLSGARTYPIVLVVEDLHWADPSSRDLVGMLLERIADAPVLLVLTFRLEFVPPWPWRAHMSSIALAKLPAAEVMSIAREFTDGRELPATIAEEIVRRTDGVPLFVEELTKAILAAGILIERDGALQVADDVSGLLQVPTTLRDSLMARLDRLGSAKAVAQLASVLGREFDFPLLSTVCDMSEAELEAELGVLTGADIVQQSGMPPRAQYRFKHALLQEAAYDTLLKQSRLRHHRRVAEAYVECFAQVLQARPELAAHHFGRAAMSAEAVPYWQQAGELALARSAYEEAIADLRAGLEQIARMAPSAERDAKELRLRVAVGPALLARMGFGAAEAGDNYARACELAETTGTTGDRFAAKWGDWLFKNTRGELVAATRRSEELVDLGRTLADDGYLLQAHHSRWTNRLFLGQFAEARADTREGLRLFDPARHRHHKHVYGGHDPYVCAHGFGASAACAMGRADECRQLLDEGRSIARELDQTLTTSIALLFRSVLSHELGDADRAGAENEELLAFCERHGIAQWVGVGRAGLGMALCAKGNTGSGIAMAESGVEAQLARGPVGFAPAVLAFTARAHLRAGAPERALDLLQQGLVLAERTRVGWQRSELQRLAAETMLQVGRIDVAAAADGLHDAAELARTQGAAALEIRALVSMLRLPADHARSAGTRQRLRALCAALDGLGSADVLAARLVLADSA
jgi:class 3 adenylate cyclase/tetratricopeptide (TPR) repeat protein